MATCDPDPIPTPTPTMTPAQIADILAKADAVYLTKVDYDAAVLAHQNAVTAAAAATTAWLNGVNTNVPDATLTTLLTDYVDKKVAESEANDARNAAAQPYGIAQTELQQATDAVIAEATAPEPPPP